MKKKSKVVNVLLILVMAILALAFLYPIFMILINSLKDELAISTNTAFDLPTKETFAGLANYVSALESQGFFESFMYSLIITVTSVLAICICCSMCAWYITRVKHWITSVLYVFLLYISFLYGSI